MAQKIHIRYPEGKSKAFTLSYDDGNDCDEILVNMMRKYQVKGTFNINSGLCPEEPKPYGKKPWTRMPMKQCLELYGDDMEIAVHGTLHPAWNRMPTPQAMVDILDDRRNLERATGKLIRGAAYPYGSYDDNVVEILRLAGIQYCRTIGGTGKLNIMHPDWLRFQATCHHKDPKLMEYAQEFVEFTLEPRRLYLFYVWGHSYEFVRENNWDVMENLLKKVSGREDIWYATNIEIVDYMNAAKQMVYNLDETIAYNPTATDIWIYYQPCKGMVKIPAGATVHLPQEPMV